MLDAINKQVLELEQEVLVLGKTGDRPVQWTATTVIGMKLDGGTHYPSCDGRAYMFTAADHPLFKGEAFCRCKHWIIPRSSIGRWMGLPINSAAEMALWFYDHVESVPEVTDPADLYDYHYNNQSGLIALGSPFVGNTVTATVAVAHLILWVAQIP